MPVPSPKRWLVERAFVDPAAVELPAGDLNLETLRPWFAAKQFVELTAAVLDRPGRGLVAAVPERDRGGRRAHPPAEVPERGGHQPGPRPVRPARRWPSRCARRVERLARAFDIEGYARLDVFWDRVDDVVYLLEINSLCGLTEATVFYSQWLADAGPAAAVGRARPDRRGRHRAGRRGWPAPDRAARAG